VKRRLLTLLAFGLASMAFAQTTPVKTETEKSSSRAEIFSERSGTLLQKQYINIGDMKSATIQVALFTDLISNQKTSAVRFEKEYKATYSSTSDTKIALLDQDEIDGLIKSLHIMQDKVYKTAPTDYTEVNFRSRSGFAAGCYFSKGKWSAYMKLEKFDSNSYVWFDMDETQSFIDLLTQAKAKLTI
jgi:hypothetical protein